VKAAPSCPLHLGVLDSPDYWTDNALVESVSPTTASEWRRWIEQSDSDRSLRNPGRRADIRG
jgi:hypothetical protein